MWLCYRLIHKLAQKAVLKAAFQKYSEQWQYQNIFLGGLLKTIQYISECTNPAY